MKYFYTTILTVIVIAIFAFAFQNNNLITINFLTYQTEVLTGAVILGSLFAGIFISAMILLPTIILKNYKIKNLEEGAAVMKEKLKNETIVYESKGLGEEGSAYENRL